MSESKSLEYHLFQFLYTIKQSVQSDNWLSNIMQIIYGFQLIVIFLIATDPTNSLSISITTNTSIFITLLVLTCLVFASTIIVFIYRINLQLYHQLAFFRFLVFPMLTLFIASDITNQSIFMPPVPQILIFLLTFITFLISSIIFHQFSNEKIVTKESQFAKMLVITDTIIVMIFPLRNTIWLWINLFSWMYLSLFIHFRKKYNYRITFNDKLTRYISTLKEYLLFIMLAKNLVFQNTRQALILFLSAPIICFAIAYKFTQPSKAYLNEQIFTANSSFQSFIDFIKIMSSELHELKNNQNLDFQRSFLMLFISAHNHNCSNSTCLLSQPSTHEQIKNSSEANNIKILMYKVIKKVESLFELYEDKFINNYELKIYLLQFYVAHLPNKLKIKQIISVLEQASLSWSNRFLMYGLSQKVDKIQVAELIDSNKGEDDHQHFKKIMSGALSNLIQFWEKLMQEKIDINQLMIISKRLFPFKKTIETIWKKHLNEQKFVSWNILRTYVFYRKSILHDYTNAYILEDYCKIIEQRLKNKHELGYINSETEKGVIAISLTESSLGNILSLNSQALKLFNYSTKTEMLELRVNDIMPGVYSAVHDGVLGSFLKNRYKQINQDQRFLFGKSKNGFIFPFLLQLRKLSWNANDELIFISNVQTAKFRTSPIYCITDIQGDIQDYTSSYAWLFMKKSKNRFEIKRQNIQQLIPSFFQFIESQKLDQSKTRFVFPQKGLSRKNQQTVQITFTVSELFIKNEKVGFLVEGTSTQQCRTSMKENKDIRSLLKSYSNLSEIYTNKFNLHKKQYEIPNTTEKTNIKTLLQRQYTIPFLKPSDFQNIFNLQQTKKNYEESIKTYRLVNNRLEMRYQEQSFHSDQDNQEWKEISVIKKIQNLKQEMNVEEDKNIGHHFKFFIFIIGALLSVLTLVLTYSVQAFESNQSNFHHNLQQKWKIKQILPQLLIYSYFPISVNTNLTLTKSIQKQLVGYLSSSSIDQWQKQTIMKVINQAFLQQALSFPSNLLIFSEQNPQSYSLVIILLYLISVLSFLYVLILIFMFFFYKYTITNIYRIFLSISQKKLQLIQEESKKLLEYLNNVYGQQPAKFITEQQISQKNQESQFQRMKKIKNDFTLEDITILCQLTFPFIIVFVSMLVAAIFISINLNKYQQNVDIWKKTSDLLPSTSTNLMNNIFVYLNHHNAQLINQFYVVQQEFQNSIFSSNLDKQSLFYVLKGDPCEISTMYPNLNLNLTELCTPNTLYLDNCISDTVNFISVYLYNNDTITQQQWIQLTKLTYTLIKPVLSYVSDQLKNTISQQRYTLENNIIVVCILMVLLIVFGTIYLSCYPIQTISEKLLFTKDLISIVPSQKNCQPQTALASLTSQAMDFQG